MWSTKKTATNNKCITHFIFFTPQEKKKRKKKDEQPKIRLKNYNNKQTISQVSSTLYITHHSKVMTECKVTPAATNNKCITHFIFFTPQEKKKKKKRKKKRKKKGKKKDEQPKIRLKNYNIIAIKKKGGSGTDPA